jgi:hypothetical protein
VAGGAASHDERSEDTTGMSLIPTLSADPATAESGKRTIRRRHREIPHGAKGEAHFHNEALNKIEKACALVTVRAKEPAEHKIYDLSVKFLRPIWL